MKVFVVTMYRYGNPEKHSYVLGVWSTKELAVKYGMSEESWRGQKYGHAVTEWIIDANECDLVGEFLNIRK